MKGEQRATFASVNAQAERMSACWSALEDYDLVGIKEGAIRSIIDAAMKLTAEADRLSTWLTENPEKYPPKWFVGRLTAASRSVLEARMALRPRG